MQQGVYKSPARGGGRGFKKPLREQEEIRRLISDPDAYTIECVASTDEEIRECLGGEQ
ncbi:MAG: hypothetical protein GXO43_09835 [Crenarchaeota archaeon]|nr:hypothetical protein [Thermoproteota archaeon]